MSAPVIPPGDDEDFVPPIPTIETEAHAEYAIDLLLSYDERIDRLKKQYEKNLKRLESEKQRAEDYFKPLLEEYAKQHPPKKGKTIHLATGDLSFRKVPGGVRIQDEEACKAWAREHLPDALVPQFLENLDAARVRLHVKETGEIGDGIVIVDDREEFYVKSPKTKKEGA